jgi:hypothetical protein
LISWAAKVKGLNQIRNTPFHRFFWDAPKDVTKGKWYEMFIKKTINIDKDVLDKVNIQTSLGKTKKKTETKTARVIDFINFKSQYKMVDYKSDNQAERCCDE